MIDLSPARKVWSVLTPSERGNAVLLVALMFIGMILETLGIGLIVPVIALLLQPDLLVRYPALQPVLNALDDPTHESIVVAAMIGLFSVYFFKALFLALLTWRKMRYAHSIQARLSNTLFSSYLRRPYTFHLQHNSAQLIRNAVNEMNVFTFNVMISGMTLLAELLVVCGLCILLVLVEPVGASIVVGVLGTVAWGFHHLTRGRVLAWGQARQHHDGLRIQHLQQGLGGVKEVMLLGREREFLDQYAVHNFQSAAVGQLQYTLLHLPRLGLELLAVAGLATLVLTMLAQGREPGAILPLLGLFAAAAFRLLPSVNRILGAIQSVRYGLPTINMVHKELGFIISPTVPTLSPSTPFRESVQFDRVTYTYPGASAPAIKDVSLVIRRGESVGFIGSSGAGKSTLVDILLGLLAPNSGEVRADGQRIQHNLRAWQDQIGYVPQTIFLTDDTLRRNVAFGVPADAIDDAAFWRAIRASQLEDFVRGLPMGMDTIVGERGVRLSGGQRQRIAIARALYHDPAIVVLDEASSSLDTATEREFMQAVDALHGTKTIIIVTHRHSTVERCDRVYRIEAGTLVGSGLPMTMLAAKTAAQAG